MQLAKLFDILDNFVFLTNIQIPVVLLELSAVATHSSSNDIISISMISFRRWEVVPRGVG